MTVGRCDQFTEIPSDRQITVSLLIVGLTLVISNTLGSSRLLRDLRFLTLPYSKRFVCRSFSGIGFHETRNAIACVTGQSARLKIAINLWVIYSKVGILTNDLNNGTIDGPEYLCSLEQCWGKNQCSLYCYASFLRPNMTYPFNRLTRTITCRGTASG